MNQHPNESEIAEVQGNLKIVDDVIHCKRISNPTPFQIQYSIQRAVEMAHEQQIHKYLIDARGTLAPSAKLRKVLREFLKCFVGHFDVMVVVIDEDPTLQVTTQFIFHNHDIPENMDFQICDTVEEGMRFLRQH